MIFGPGDTFTLDANDLDLDLGSVDPTLQDAPLDSPSDPAQRLGLFDALAPLVTDVQGASDRHPQDDPFQALIADIAIHRSRESSTAHGDDRRALLRAIAEMAETHAVAADLACEQAAIDLPLDVPDPVPPAVDAATTSGDGGAAASMLIVPDMIRTCRDRLAVHTTAADRS